MKQFVTTFSLILTYIANLLAQVPANSKDIMLQGFYWESQNETGWTQLIEYADEIGKNFTTIWLPPSAAAEGDATVGGTNVGYHPRIWNNQNSCWGTATDLKTLINTLHDNNVKVIADIVINHRAGYTSWATFAPDDFGSYGSFQLTANHICKNDELNTNTSAGSEYGTASGATDTGDNWSGARDLDHNSEYVQNDIKAYLKWLKGEYGYDGWRYDLVKGYGAQYVGTYNDASAPYIAVGEYWDSSYDNVWNWIQGTNKKSMAFDFPAKYALFNNGLAQGNFSNMSWKENGETPRPAGLIHHAQSNLYAITFVDNHDTYRDDNKFSGDWPQAYAVLLSAPGIPCVFWEHWKYCKDVISQQIAARKAAGIHSQSSVTVTNTNGYYECYSEGTNGTLICRVGNVAPSTAPEGYYLACTSSNNDWYYFLPNGLNLSTSVNYKLQENVSTKIEGNILNITTQNPIFVTITTIGGQTIVSKEITNNTQIELPCGISIVKIGNEIRKVIIKNI